MDGLIGYLGLLALALVPFLIRLLLEIGAEVAQKTSCRQKEMCQNRRCVFCVDCRKYAKGNHPKYRT